MYLMRICATTLLWAPTAAFAASAFDGTWKEDPTHVQLPKQPSILMLNNDMFTCQSCTPAVTVQADGKDQKLSGTHDIDSRAVTVVDSHTVTAVDKLNGRPVQTTTWVIAADGNSLVREVTLSYGSAPSTYKVLFTREADGPTGAHLLSGSWHQSKLISAKGPDTVVTYGMTDDGFTMSSNGQSYSAKFDDRTYPVAGDPAKTEVSLKKISNTEVIETDHQQGSIVDIIHITVLPGGKALEVEDTQIPSNRVTVFKMTRAP
jgi:hypothetical protein